MTRLLAVVCLLLSTFASASDYLTVTGSGKSFEEAKQQAFRKAIEFKVGATVLSDVETQNYKRVKDEIYVYSAGYVDDYKVLGQENTTSGITVMMEVSVAESKLKNRILAVGKDGTTFNGEQHAAQIDTYVQEKVQGDQLFQKILNDYPTKAFVVKQSTYTIKMDQNRNPVLYIPYELAWNPEYLKSLRETLDTIEECTPRWSTACSAKVVINGKNNASDLLGKTTQHFFNDVIRNDQLHNRFHVYGSPRLDVRFYDMYNNYLTGTCVTPRFIFGSNTNFYSTSRRNVSVVEGFVTEAGIIPLTLPLSVIDKITKIEITVVANNKCGK